MSDKIHQQKPHGEGQVQSAGTRIEQTRSSESLSTTLLDRRTAVTRGLGTGLSAVALAGTLSSSPQRAEAQATPIPDDGDGAIVVTEQGVYRLPQDHKFHGGPLYENSGFAERYSVFGVLQHPDSNDTLAAVFVHLSRAGYDPATGQPVTTISGALADLSSLELFSAVERLKDPFHAESNPDRPDDFFYTWWAQVGDWPLNYVRYDAEEERWTWSLFPGVGGGDVEIYVELSPSLQAPGYLPMTPSGIEVEGLPATGKYRPETMSNLSYAYMAPNLDVFGSVMVADNTYSLKGRLWMEHQWGNFRATGSTPSSWLQGRVRLDDGRLLTWRQWHEPSSADPVFELTRFAIVELNGDVRFGYGRDVEYRPTAAWHSPRSGASYDIYGQLETPIGSFSVAPLFDDQEITWVDGAVFWEGVSAVRARTADGPVVGSMWFEQHHSTAG